MVTFEVLECQDSFDDCPKESTEIVGRWFSLCDPRSTKFAGKRVHGQ